MFKHIIVLLAIAGLLPGCFLKSQDVPPRLETGYAPLDEKLAGLVTADEWAISAAEARALPAAVYLDARGEEEFAVSHLPDALHLGYPEVRRFLLPSQRNTPLVVYCTVGYRSERSAEKLRQLGYTRVYNLYGSLYAWKLAGYPLVDAAGEATQKLHTYNRKWGSFVPDSIGTKVH